MVAKNFWNLFCSFVKENQTNSNFTLQKELENIFNSKNSNHEVLPFLVAVLVYMLCFLLLTALRFWKKTNHPTDQSIDQPIAQHSMRVDGVMRTFV